MVSNRALNYFKLPSDYAQYYDNLNKGTLVLLPIWKEGMNSWKPGMPCKLLSPANSSDVYGKMGPHGERI